MQKESKVQIDISWKEKSIGLSSEPQSKVGIIAKYCAKPEDDEFCEDNSKLRAFKKNATRFATDFKYSCCKGDLCNSGKSLKQNLFSVFIVVLAVLMV